MQDLQQGSELAGRYTLVKKLGSGGAGETWLANDRVAHASVALKILTSDRVSAAHFHKEWQTGIRLMHAHIVRVFEYEDSDETPFYSLQFIDGPDSSVLSGAAPGDILGPVGLIADALRYAHAKGIVHRDIKAANILLDQNGAPYLIDFGVAATDGASASGGSLISASPQSLAGETPQPADDIFALGGLIYELVSGRSPYSSQATAEDIQHKVPAPLTAAAAAPLPPAIVKLVAAMLDKDAAARPTAATVAQTLQAAGFAPAPAPRQYVAGPRSVAEEIIEASDHVHTTRAKGAAAVADEAAPGSGLSPRVTIAAFVVLLTLLIGVVFFLPEPQSGSDEAESASEAAATTGAATADEGSTEQPQRDPRVVSRNETERVLGELLSKMETLQSRAVQRWGGLRFKQAESVYAEGDAAYLARDYDMAAQKYAAAIDIIDPLLDEVDQVFTATYAEARQALDNADSVEAVRLFELAVAISPNHAGARAGYVRAQNLETVMSLTDQGFAFENELELEAARESFARAVEIDPEWLPAKDGLERVLGTLKQMEFDARMSEGLAALADGDYAAARAAFRMAERIMPGSPDPADGLLQVDQGMRLDRIARLEAQAKNEERQEAWETAIETYKTILEIDDSLMFAQDGMTRATQMTALHEQLDDYIDDPDQLSAPATMARATRLVVDITRMPEIGPRLSNQRDELSRLLKRAATPLTVTLVSDNMTDVSIYKVGKLGSFETRQLDLRPGTYVAVGVRPGFRDVRLEFRVAPEIDLQPVVVRCEEAI